MQPTVVKKDEAKAIDKAAEAKKAEIDQTPNATDEEKVAAKAKVDEAVTTAKNAIDQTTNNVGVDAAKEWSRINQSQPAVVKKIKQKQKTTLHKLRKQKSIETQMRQTKKSSSKSESR